jgi:hypothetical protein
VGLFVLLNTYSSSALLCFILSIPVIMMFYRIRVSKNIISVFIIILLMLVANILIVQSNKIDNNSESGSFIENIYDRTFGRAQDELENDRQETIVWNTFQKSDPIYHVFGWGIAQYSFHTGYVWNTGITPMQSGLVLTLVDFGILGLLFLFYLFAILIRNLSKYNKLNDVYAVVFSMGAIISFIGSLTYGNVTGCFVFLMLSVFAFYDGNKEIV